MAGYSGTPLVKKLGIKEGSRVVLVGAPVGFEAVLGTVPAGVVLEREVPRSGEVDVMVYFATRAAELRRQFARLAKRLKPAGGLWIAWPKGTSGVRGLRRKTPHAVTPHTDLTGNAVRDIGLEAGLVDNKVCAIDETWSGLRFVWRLRDRPVTNRTGRD